eukprot:COSAG02_NODE_59726_length_273_cov_0.879310_1_plen_52_part_01
MSKSTDAEGIEMANPMNENADEPNAVVEVNADDAVYIKLGLKKQFTDGDVDA